MFTNRNNHRNHSFFMRLALAQAQRNLGKTSENPSVGCVITKNSYVISAASTSLKGRPHAEQNAINFCKENLKKSQLYVTLEPCSNYGKTPPCVQFIIDNKIDKVFFSIKDPDARSFNRSTDKLKNKGIRVNEGLLKNKVNFFYRSYFKSKNENLPFVTYKLAISKDFYSINTQKGKYITNKFSRDRVHLMRSNHDCIITSSDTIIKDNSKLTCRINGLEDKSPSRIILDNKLKIPLNSNIIKSAGDYKTVIFYNKTNKNKIKLLKKLNVKLYKISLNNEGNLDIKKSLIKAKKLNFSRIFLESGIKLAKSFIKENLVDDFKLFISNKKLSKFGRTNVEKYLRSFLKNKKHSIEKVNLFGDKLVSYNLK